MRVVIQNLDGELKDDISVENHTVIRTNANGDSNIGWDKIELQW